MSPTSHLGAVLMVLGCCACAARPAAAPGAKNVLFIGDSFTYAQGGLDTHFTRLAAVATPLIPVNTDRAVEGGAYLKRLWDMGSPVKAIDTGKFDTVILQDDIPETNPDYFREYARKFVNEVRAHNGRPVLLMAWAYKRLSWISMEEIAKLHRDIGKELNVDVAPVGLAWQRAALERPALDMYGPDREHPSIHGMYLEACVVFATVYGIDPTGFTYAPPGVSSDQAAFLQRMAWASLRDYRM